RLRFSGPKTSIICSPMTSLKTSIKTITYLSDIGCLEIQGASLLLLNGIPLATSSPKTRFGMIGALVHMLCVFLSFGDSGGIIGGM
ncbi:hypothetical protein, partial [Escherichia coli]|uniref:hypothetical protein n=1 Tax=Escherichia coli TaxID=562 RepID=UPI003859C3C8